MGLPVLSLDCLTPAEEEAAAPAEEAKEKRSADAQLYGKHIWEEGGGPVKSLFISKRSTTYKVLGSG